MRVLDIQTDQSDTSKKVSCRRKLEVNTGLETKVWLDQEGLEKLRKNENFPIREDGSLRMSESCTLGRELNSSKVTC